MVTQRSVGGTAFGVGGSASRGHPHQPALNGCGLSASQRTEVSRHLLANVGGTLFKEGGSFEMPPEPSLGHVRLLSPGYRGRLLIAFRACQSCVAAGCRCL